MPGSGWQFRTLHFSSRCLLLTPGAQAATTYSYTTITPPANCAALYPNAINQSGQVSGYYEGTNGHYHAFLYPKKCVNPLLEESFGTNIYSNNYMIFNKKASFSGNMRLPNDT